MRQIFIRRARLLSGALMLLAALIVVRLYFLQIVQGDDFKRRANNQYVETSPEAIDRGSIFFTTKDGSLVSAAIMQAGWRVAINPALVSDPESAYKKISAVMPLDRAKFMASAAKKNDPYEDVALRVNDDQARAVRALKIPGVMTPEDRWRTYPGADLASHALGFIGYRGDQKAGRYGIERSYEATLARGAGGLYVNPFAQIFGNVASLVTTDPAAREGDVVTSIEPTVEQHLEDTLDQVMKTYTPKLAGGIVMDPKTGEIIAIAARPDFDPNAFSKETSAAVFSNPIVESVFEMGSIMKPLTMAAGIDSGAVTQKTTYNDTGCMEKSGKKVCNYDFKARGVVPMQEVLNQSLNVGASFIAEKIGRERFSNYMREYGFGQRTGIDLPNEAVGIISSLSSGSDIDQASASFGQGIAVTPLEMVRALAALANEGKLPPPHVVRAIRYESGLSRSPQIADEVVVLKPDSAEQVTNMLVTVYDKALLKGALKMTHYSIAAKTGTAQIAKQGGGGYYDDRYLHSFFGYFPAHEPKFIILLFAVEPHGAQFASASLAHPFADLAKFLINYYDIPPDR